MHLYFLKWVLALSVFTGFYDLSYTASNGTQVSLADFSGKRLLLVNIATGSPRTATQLATLQQVQQQYGDSVIVIAFPSNSFGNEPLSDSSIRQLCTNQYGATFRIAAKGPVVGAGIQPIYSWLTSDSSNTSQEMPITHDFEKFVISREGKLVGIFSGALPANHPSILSAINNN